MTDLTTSRWFNRSLAVAILLLLFATGVATGFGLARWTESSREPALSSRRGAFARGPHYYSGLGLDPAQERAVQAIYEKHRPALDAVLEETTPRVRAIHDQIELEIRSLLTPDQVERLERQKNRRPHGFRGKGRRRTEMGGPRRGPMDGSGPEGFSGSVPHSI